MDVRRDVEDPVPAIVTGFAGSAPTLQIIDGADDMTATALGGWVVGLIWLNTIAGPWTLKNFL